MGHLGTTWSITSLGERWRHFAWSFVAQTGACRLLHHSGQHTFEQGNPGTAQLLRQKEVVEEMHFFTLSFTHTPEVLCVFRLRKESLTPDNSYLENFLSTLFDSRFLAVGKLFALLRPTSFVVVFTAGHLRTTDFSQPVSFSAP